MNGLHVVSDRRRNTYTHGLPPDPQVTLCCYTAPDLYTGVVHDNIECKGRTVQLLIRHIHRDDTTFCKKLLTNETVKHHQSTHVDKKMKAWFSEDSVEKALLVCYRNGDVPIGVLELKPYEEDGMEVSVLIQEKKEVNDCEKQVGEWLQLLVKALDAEKQQLWKKPIKRIVAFVSDEDKKTRAVAEHMGMVKSRSCHRGKELYIYPMDPPAAPKEPPKSWWERVVTYVRGWLDVIDG